MLILKPLKEGLSTVRNSEEVLEIEIWTRNIHSHIWMEKNDEEE